MSEYQSYEFVAVDDPLSPRSMAALRSISSRADITPTRFSNEYHWGDLKADPADLLARYFDAHLYFANWGTRRLMLRVPAARVDYPALRPYFPGGAATLKKAGRFVLLDVLSDCEDPEDDMLDAPSVGTFVPLRARLLQGDPLVAYLAWLVAVEAGDVPADRREPPVPAGRATPSAAVTAFAEFFRLDRELLRAAAEGSRPNDVDVPALRRWLKSVPAADKDRWLVQAVTQPDALPTAAILAAQRRGREEIPHVGRTVAELGARAEELRAQPERPRRKGRSTRASADARASAAPRSRARR
jgi:hypothetical protein